MRSLGYQFRCVKCGCLYVQIRAVRRANSKLLLFNRIKGVAKCELTPPPLYSSSSDSQEKRRLRVFPLALQADTSAAAY